MGVTNTDYLASVQGLKTKLNNRSAVIRYIITPLLLFLVFSTFLQWYILVEDYVEPEVWEVLPDEALATRLHADQVMSQPLVSGSDMYSIPRYLHQSWMSDELPRMMSRWSQTCRSQNRRWKWILWTNEDNEKMVETFFPWFLDTYRALPAEINRADAARNMYMYLFGGVYADLDTECLEPFDGLFNEHSARVSDTTIPRRTEQAPVNMSASQIAFFGRMAYDGDWTKFHTIPNAWMAASPGHPFFLLVLERLRAAVIASRNKYKTTAEALTGPVALYHAIEEYDELVTSGTSLAQHFASNPSYAYFDRNSTNLRMELLPPQNIYPFSWNHQGLPWQPICLASSRKFNSAKCKQLLATDSSYAITYWSHTWNQDLHKTHDSHKLNAISS